MLESNVWGESGFLFIHTTWIGNDLLKIRKMNSTELILKTAYLSAIALAAILKTRSARRLARCLLPAFLCAHIFIKRETSGYEAGSYIYIFCFWEFTFSSHESKRCWTVLNWTELGTRRRKVQPTSYLFSLSTFRSEVWLSGDVFVMTVFELWWQLKGTSTLPSIHWHPRQKRTYGQ